MTFRKILHWIPSACTLAAILWLTLASRPLPDMDIPMFEGIDKVVHAIMMGGLTGALMFDYRRNGRWCLRNSNAGHQHVLTPGVIAVICFSVAAFSAADEWAQGALTIARSADIYDFFADLVGIAVAAMIATPTINWLLGARRERQP